MGRVLSRTIAPRRSCFLSARLPAWYKKLRTAHYFSTGIRNLRLSKNFLPFGWPGRPGRVPPKDPAKKAAEAEQKRRDAHKKATIDFDKVYDDRKRYLDAGIGDEFAGWRADIERLPDRFARPFQSRPRGASRPVRLGLPGRFGVRTGCQFPQVCPPPCRSATSGAPGTNLGYLTHATTPPGRRTFAAGSSAPACAASASSGRAPRA